MNIDEFFNGLKQSVQTAFENTAVYQGEIIAEDFKRQLVEGIKSESISTSQGWKPLNPDYFAKKVKLGLDRRTLIASGEYIKNILTTAPIISNNDVTYKVYPSNLPVKASPVNKNPSPSLTYAKLAIEHEYGVQSRNLPPRPHWGPAKTMMAAKSKQLAESMQIEFNKNINTEAKKLLANIAK